VIYWDTSALLKAYAAREAHHARALNLRDSVVRHVSSALLRTELVGAVCSRLFGSRRVMKAMVDEALEDLKDWTLLAVDPHLEPAEALCERHGLRGADAIHLASALTLRREVTRKFRFASADRRQLSAARAEGLRVIDLG
jgi:predicted nucleic acid-binding protein